MHDIKVQLSLLDNSTMDLKVIDEMTVSEVMDRIRSKANEEGKGDDSSLRTFRLRSASKWFTHSRTVAQCGITSGTVLKACKQMDGRSRAARRLESGATKRSFAHSDLNSLKKAVNDIGQKVGNLESSQSDIQKDTSEIKDILTGKASIDPTQYPEQRRAQLLIQQQVTRNEITALNSAIKEKKSVDVSRVAEEAARKVEAMQDAKEKAKAFAEAVKKARLAHAAAKKLVTAATRDHKLAKCDEKDDKLETLNEATQDLESKSVELTRQMELKRKADADLEAISPRKKSKASTSLPSTATADDVREAEEGAGEMRAAEEARAAEIRAVEEAEAGEMRAAEEAAAGEMRAAEEAKAAEMRVAEEAKAAEMRAVEEAEASETRAVEEARAAEMRAETRAAQEAKASEIRAAEQAKAAEMRAANEAELTFSLARSHRHMAFQQMQELEMALNLKTARMQLRNFESVSYTLLETEDPFKMKKYFQVILAWLDKDLDMFRSLVKNDDKLAWDQHGMQDLKRLLQKVIDTRADLLQRMREIEFGKANAEEQA